LAQQRKQLERDLDCLENSVSFSRSLLKNATDHQLDSHLPLITDQLNRLNKDKSFNKSTIETKHLEMDEIKKQGPIMIDLSDCLEGIKLVDRRAKGIIKAILENVRTLYPLRFNSESRCYVAFWRPKLMFGSFGSEEGQFNLPRNVTIDRENNIIVCDTDNRRIQMFDEEGRFLRSERFEGVKKGEDESIIAASVDLDGNIVMFGVDSHQIIIFDPISRQIIRRFGGKRGSEDGQFNWPQSLCVDHLNRIIVCDTFNHRIQIFDHKGKHLLSFGSEGPEDGQFKQPHGFTVDHLNKIIVCDSNNHRIQMFDEEGNHLLSFGSEGSEDGQFYQPTRVAVDHHNSILISEWGNNRIQVFDPQGKWIHSFGSFGEGNGQFNRPQGITVDHLNRIITTDVDNRRVQIF